MMNRQSGRCGDLWMFLNQRQPGRVRRAKSSFCPVTAGIAFFSLCCEFTASPKNETSAPLGQRHSCLGCTCGQRLTRIPSPPSAREVQEMPLIQPPKMEIWLGKSSLAPQSPSSRRCFQLPKESIFPGWAPRTGNSREGLCSAEDDFQFADIK